MAVDKQYEYDAFIPELPEKGGAYVVFPWNIREEFGKGRVKVHATFDGIPYDGSIVNMGVKKEDGSVCFPDFETRHYRFDRGKNRTVF